MPLTWRLSRDEKPGDRTYDAPVRCRRRPWVLGVDALVIGTAGDDVADIAIDVSSFAVSIDDSDTSDAEFESLLLEILSDFQVSIPELGTVSAAVPPTVILTSNSERNLGDALKRQVGFEGPNHRWMAVTGKF